MKAMSLLTGNDVRMTLDPLWVNCLHHEILAEV
ncbi:hypothetical protein GGR33_003917 [Methylobacterium brachythecii]|uniref:Uncharacterized protein n=1 Tax=Methylobacterium brachythecii TaxID=1176177 RepID=A0A7W6F8F0_9HYPH|nr:hypothetical protein [Methylobacterium brachythecii]